MGSTKVAAPPARDLYSETRDTLQAQVDLAPQQYASEAQYRPLYQALDIGLLEQALLGSAGGTRTNTRTVNDTTPAGFYDAQGRLVSTDPMWKPTAQQRVDARRYGEADLMGGVSWRQQQVTPREITETVTDPAQRGLLDLYESELYPAMSRMEEADQGRRIASDLAAVNKYGGAVVRGLREASGNAPIMDALTGQAVQELDAGAYMDPGLARAVAQSVRAGQSARGLGRGRGDVAEEAMFTGLQAEQLRRNRQGFAMQVAGLNQATAADPFMAILGRSSGTQNGAASMAGQGAALGQAGPRLFDPMNQYAQDLYNTNYNAQASAGIASANNRAARNAGFMQMGGSVLGAFAAILA